METGIPSEAFFMRHLVKNKTILKSVENAAAKKVNVKYQLAKAELLNSFDSHPVTKEIEEGIGAENISGTLDGYGDLFSFIGFTHGTDPIRPVREVLSYGTMTSAGFQNGAFVFLVPIPAKKQIEAVSIMRWETGRSWVYGIEEGISGFGHYMESTRFSDSKKSYSKQGFQVEENIHGGKFHNIKYMSELLRNFRKMLK